ncbi:MAG: NAD kinase [Betaproteobacteria bacterium]|nr:NAD kinase [Betaproteobacteria bacterium]
MNPMFRHIALMGKHHPSANPGTGATAKPILLGLAQKLAQQGFLVSIEQETAAHIDLNGFPTLEVAGVAQSCDLAIVLGGDGTMLGYGRQLAPHGVPLIGINQGRLGFITDIALDQIEATLQPMLHGEFEEDRRMLMHGQVWRDGACVFEALALNDVVVNRGASSGMVELRVSVDGHFVANQRADGLIIATPTGSTAYALSAGGPMLQPSLAGLVMVPIAPHTLSNRPLVLADPAEIVIELVSGRDASANFDMQSLSSLHIGDQVKVRKSPHNAVFLHPRGWTYFDTLRQKLHWNGGGS